MQGLERDPVTREDVLAQTRKRRLETVRVLFADQHGILRGKTVVADALATVLDKGLMAPSTLLLKDTSHRTVFPVWSGDPGSALGMAGGGDILLRPDPATFRVLPWAPHSGWIFCDLFRKNGAPIAFSPRQMLRAAINRLGAHGIEMRVGLEVEFHVFEIIDKRREHADATMPGQPPLTRNLSPGYQFLTDAQYARLEPVMDDLRRNAQGLGLPVRSMEVEMGPSQFEFTFDPADPLTHADNLMMFRAMAKEVCAARGLHATFMTRPALENAAASGWHVHQSLMRGDVNLMTPEDDALTNVASAWIAGLLRHAEASCLLTTPTVNGYKRYRPHQLAPDRIAWGRDNRGAMLRALMVPGDAAARVENRVPEAAANPYHVLTSQILSGLDGIENGLHAPAPVETPYDTEAPALPASLLAAVETFGASEFYASALGEDTVRHLTTIRRAEWDRYHAAVSAWEQAEYFDLY